MKQGRVQGGAHRQAVIDAFQMLYGSVPQPVFLVDTTGLIVTRNHSASIINDDEEQLVVIYRDRIPDAEAVFFRLGRRAIAQGAIEARVQCLSGRDRVTVNLLDKDLLIWSFFRGEDTTVEPMGGNPGAPESSRTLEDVPVAVLRLSPGGRIRYANHAARDLLKLDNDSTLQLDELVEGVAKSIPDRLKETMQGRAQGRSEVAKGKLVEGFLQVTMARAGDAADGEILAVVSDATELKTLEAQFVQSQKMQAVGQLAGGIAHDFNNLLTAINGHCDLLLLRHVQGDGDHPDLMQIKQNANRAASLVGQLLAFSRKQTLRPKVLNLYDTLSELANLLNRLLGEKMELILHNPDDIWPVKVDERQLEQVVVNLVVNARDAMPEGGAVTIRTSKVELEVPLERDRATVPAGRYSVIYVEDTGTGIPVDKREKVFEPFFTTKKVGEGTGLGLSTAYGIIKQMEGFLFFDTEEGQGTRFSIYLPTFAEEDGAGDPFIEPTREEKAPREAMGKGTVLLVEDEAPVRSFACRALQIRGYSVIEAESGERALEILADPELQVDVFVTDVVMPGLDGPNWIRKALEARPHVSTIFVSGYSQDNFKSGQDRVPNSSYLAKPFTLNDLTERVRDHFDRFVAKSADG